MATGDETCYRRIVSYGGDPMKNRRVLSLIISAIGILLLILDAKTALSSASDGLALCMTTVIPSLFPFFILSAIINSALIGTRFSVLRPISRLCHIPEGAESILLIGLIGGYPVGATGISQAYKTGVLCKKDSERMLSFCNNAGPAFIFGLLSQLLGNIILCWVLWIIHILSAVLVGMIMPGGSKKTAAVHCTKPIALPQAMQIGIKNMALVCGWVVLFRVILGFMTHWFLWLLSPTLQSVIAGFLEMSNGCLSLVHMENVSTRFLCAAGFLSFGGICVAMQTASVTAALSLRQYYIGKVLQTAFSLLLSALFLIIFPLP